MSGRGLYNNTSGERSVKNKQDMFDDMRKQVGGARQAFLNAILENMPDDKGEKVRRTGKI